MFGKSHVRCRRIHMGIDYGRPALPFRDCGITDQAAEAPGRQLQGWVSIRGSICPRPGCGGSHWRTYLLSTAILAVRVCAAVAELADAQR